MLLSKFFSNYCIPEDYSKLHISCTRASLLLLLYFDRCDNQELFGECFSLCHILNFITFELSSIYPILSPYTILIWNVIGCQFAAVKLYTYLVVIANKESIENINKVVLSQLSYFLSRGIALLKERLKRATLNYE